MPVRIGFVGAGGMNSAHMSNLSQIKGVELVAFADPFVERANERANQYGGKAFDCWKTMFSEVPMDAVYVAVPPFAHEGQELEAAKRGIHMFVEKPVATELKYAKSVYNAIKKAGVISTAGFQDRYQDIVKKMQGILETQKPALIMGYWIGGMPGVPWWRVKSESGGQAVEQTIHTFDMARYLFGEVKLVHCTYSVGLMTDVPNYDVEDATAVNLQFESGLCGTIFSGCFVKEGGPSQVGLDMWCPHAKIQYAGRSSLTVTQGAKAKTISVGNNFLMDIDKTFVNAVKKQDQSLLKSSYADACRSLAVPLAANESIKTGKAVAPAKFED